MSSTAIREPGTSLSTDELLNVSDLSVEFSTRRESVQAVNGVSFSLQKGEVLCIIGESGSGKSVTMRSLMRLLPESRTHIGGNITLDGQDVLAMRNRQLTAMRGSKVSMIFQEPMTALDPVYSIGDQIAEGVMRHLGKTRKEATARALELLELVRVPSPERRLRAYPHELSGGLRQRAMIAVALSCAPKLLLADEPTTALDATVQIQVLILLKKLQEEMGMGIIFVTHDLGVAAQIADKVAVMYAGRLVEYGLARDILLNPRHPYTIGMLNSTVRGQDRSVDIEAIPGNPPDLRNLPPGCAFAPRCGFALEQCSAAQPEPAARPDAGYARCIRLDETAKVAERHPIKA
ncbi:ABC transporter ATP-binding protein [Devosia pacifica]|uniref:ABC transporter ATP-binding protein n=1 Tax=Devosia pacifica TaxID=1335967 RepID=A0A918S115_9HYPH|nr:ABC transporter ATP-binding protein [Devosia pacifica]GHA19152.1 ABC transporter ATP-binding protein [Devosia pacifica]